MKCIVGHEIRTETGFKVFDAGQDYPASEIEGREHYFEKEPAAAAKITEEVADNDAG